MTQIVASKSTTTQVAVSPLARFVRTAVQIVGAFAAAEPVLIAGLHFSGTRASEIAAIVGGLVGFVTGAQNLLEKLGWIPVVGGKAPTAPVAS